MPSIIIARVFWKLFYPAWRLLLEKIIIDCFENGIVGCGFELEELGGCKLLAGDKNEGKD